MIDISNELVDIMSKEKCSSVYALFHLEKESNYVSNNKQNERDNMGTRDRRSKSLSTDAQ